MIEYYVSGVAILIGAILIIIVFIIDREKAETEFEQDVLQQPKESGENTNTWERTFRGPLI